VTPEQLRALATRLRRKYPPPAPLQSAGQYVRNLAMHELADGLDELADE